MTPLKIAISFRRLCWYHIIRSFPPSVVVLVRFQRQRIVNHNIYPLNPCIRCHILDLQARF